MKAFKSLLQLKRPLSLWSWIYIQCPHLEAVTEAILKLHKTLEHIAIRNQWTFLKNLLTPSIYGYDERYASILYKIAVC